MKATINFHGELKVTAENDLESYALNRWADEYFKLANEKPSRIATLMTEYPVFEEQNQGE